MKLFGRKKEVAHKELLAESKEEPTTDTTCKVSNPEEAELAYRKGIENTQKKVNKFAGGVLEEYTSELLEGRDHFTKMVGYQMYSQGQDYIPTSLATEVAKAIQDTLGDRFKAEYVRGICLGDSWIVVRRNNPVKNKGTTHHDGEPWGIYIKKSTKGNKNR